MRIRKSNAVITVNAIAGTHVVFFGLDIATAKKKNFKGFAIKRLDHSNDEVIWLRGIKTFEKTEPHPTIGETFSSQKHPIQSFQWADYSAKPGIKYTFTIIAMYGDPNDLEERSKIEIVLKTEVEAGPKHSVYFNRGSVATQEYARKFMNKTPDKAGPGAYEWLSRGLIEALVKFIDDVPKGHHIYGAVYEFQYPQVLEAIKRAAKRKVKTMILFDDVRTVDSKGEFTGPTQINRDAIKTAGIKDYCRGRKNAKLMHNKFFVVTDTKDKPKIVWGGSTNITLNGIFGHSNLGHVVNNPDIAQDFKDYWDRLEEDPKIDNDYRDANMEASPIPVNIKKGTTAIFSPRRTGLDSLNWYAQIADKAENALFMTFAFGMHEKFKEIYSKDDDMLRMALMEKAFSSPKVKERDEEDIKNIRKLPNVVVALGNRIVTNAFDRWLWEMRSVDGQGKHVYWIHTKYMLVDPLGDDPIVISGSANFSKASTDTNDENMIIVKGDKRIADIYFGEYIRLFAHYSFREAVKWAMEKQKLGQPQEWKPQFLIENDTWMKDYFDPKDTSARRKRREYFAGEMSV